MKAVGWRTLTTLSSPWMASMTKRLLSRPNRLTYSSASIWRAKTRRSRLKSMCTTIRTAGVPTSRCCTIRSTLGSSALLLLRNAWWNSTRPSTGSRNQPVQAVSASGSKTWTTGTSRVHVIGVLRFLSGVAKKAKKSASVRWKNSTTKLKRPSKLVSWPRIRTRKWASNRAYIIRRTTTRLTSTVRTWMTSPSYLHRASQWSVNSTWLTYGSTRVPCLMPSSTIRSKTRKSWTTVHTIRLTSSPKVWTRLVVGSLRSMPSLPWYSIVFLIRMLSRTVSYSTRTVTRCQSAWAMPLTRSVPSNNMVLTHCVGTWLQTHHHGITWSSTWTVWWK